MSKKSTKPLFPALSAEPAAPITYGYVRVSSKDQNEARQVVAMHEFGIDDAHIVIEKMSGKNFNRPQYRALLEQLRPDDVLVVQSIDRLGRNYEEILQQWSDLTKVYHVGIVVLDMPLLDTRKGRDLTGRLVADLVLQIFSYVAQQEREHIRQRQAEGIAAAKARGIRFGRERIPLPPSFAAFAELWSQKQVSARSAARNLGISTQTFLRRVREYYPDLTSEPTDDLPELVDLADSGSRGSAGD